MSLPRFFKKSLQKNSEFIVLDKEHLHHIKVLRLKPNDKIKIFNGIGLEFFCKLEVGENKSFKARIISSKIKNRPTNHILAIAVLKQNTMDSVIRQATELGITHIYPFISKYVTVSMKHTIQRIERWKRISISASEQSGRSYLPIIHQPFQLNDFNVEKIENELSEKLLKIFYWEFSKVLTPNFESLNEVSGSISIIGPEGGFASDEKELFEKQGFVCLSLGDIILKADTASVAGISKTKFIFDILKAKAQS